VPNLGNRLRFLGFDVFDDWWGAGERADDSWQQYEDIRGRSYKEALAGDAADNIFSWDVVNLNKSDVAVLFLPAGKSGHIEFGYMVGQNKPAFVLFDEVPKRYDLMYRFASDVFFDVEDLLTMFDREF
jgi:nucleoside 2-deoxyribosyltransferase